MQEAQWEHPLSASILPSRPNQHGDPGERLAAVYSIVVALHTILILDPAAELIGRGTKISQDVGRITGCVRRVGPKSGYQVDG